MSELEFSRPFRVDDIPPEGVDRRISADQAECGRLAERFGIVKLTRLEGALTLAHSGRDVRITGTLEADAVQNCVVTLEPQNEAVCVPVSRAFRPAPPGANADAGPVSGTNPGDIPEDLDPASDTDEVDWIFGGRIDLGEVLAEELALALEPYPRAPGVRLEDVLSEAPGEADAHPFAALQRLKEPSGEGRT